MVGWRLVKGREWFWKVGGMRINWLWLVSMVRGLFLREDVSRLRI